MCVLIGFVCANWGLRVKGGVCVLMVGYVLLGLCVLMSGYVLVGGCVLMGVNEWLCVVGYS